MTKRFKVTITTSGEYVISSVDTSGVTGIESKIRPAEGYARIVTSSDKREYEDFFDSLNQRFWGIEENPSDKTNQQDDDVQVTAP